MRLFGLELSLRRCAALIGWGAVAVVVFATLSPIGARPHLAHLGPQIERFAAYLVAAAALATAYPARKGVILLCIVAGAAGLELAQHFEASRHARALDALVKILGGLTGLAVVALCERLWLKRIAGLALAKRPD
ncbi:VanZ family protein [Bosea vestrisii]|uniref:VanZ family protein n=1 Tax=Bosea vestrisii TaxID=151416 RepID=UPI0024E00F38|nr:VanZ family protein [Bosea vestrisii]WID97424.1 VanZ family protein [Bosea vestrisii]